jgi:HSP20 family molecular chaperone IbpA|tara:strand:- start:808 stop:1272 length:465 start_codon:yes stop_codon:yes gene_type:complete
MSRMSIFNSPLLLGFEPFEQLLERVSKTAPDGYPPYNIEQTAEHRLRITLAVAGFTDDDLSVSVEGNQLLVQGRQDAKSESETRRFLHRGIAARQFQRNFVLADGLEVSVAKLEHGLLHIDIDQPLPATRSRPIPIDTGDEVSSTPELKAVGES